MIAHTPKPPYYAVIFTSLKTVYDEGYENTSDRMVELAKQQPGFLGYESARNELGITVSYWQTPEDIKNWKMNLEHQLAQKTGKEKWYSQFKVRVCKVDRDYGFEAT
jgi:heme-degrading monooxygenase HmoA